MKEPGVRECYQCGASTPHVFCDSCVRYSSESVLMDVLRKRVVQLEDEIERLCTRGCYGLPCERCGGPHVLDTSIPAEVWKAITDDGRKWNLLCTICIDELCQEAGIEVEARFYYVGAGLIGAPYVDDSRP